MPSNIKSAINFLETQWSSVTENKIKGIKAEIRLENYLYSADISPLIDYIIPGGWIISPGKNTLINTTTTGRIALLPIPTRFSWTENLMPPSLTAQILAESYFRQVGIKTYFTKFDSNPENNDESDFQIPRKGNYVTSYTLDFYKIGANGLDNIPFQNAFYRFPDRVGKRGMRAYNLDRINNTEEPWNNSSAVTKLFWKEYCRYYIHRNKYVSSNDLDFFLVGKSGKAYPVELKSKTVYIDNNIGDWFGIDVGPFTKLSFFVSLSNNMEALYFVEEINDEGQTINWLGIKFSELLKYCHWVTQGGGKGMGGGSTTTIKVPRSVFINLQDLLPRL